MHLTDFSTDAYSTLKKRLVSFSYNIPSIPVLLKLLREAGKLMPTEHESQIIEALQELSLKYQNDPKHGVLARQIDAFIAYYVDVNNVQADLLYRSVMFNMYSRRVFVINALKDSLILPSAIQNFELDYDINLTIEDNINAFVDGLSKDVRRYLREKHKSIPPFVTDELIEYAVNTYFKACFDTELKVTADRLFHSITVRIKLAIPADSEIECQECC